MKPGEVSFKSLKQCGRLECYARDQKILNRLAKSRVEIYESVEELLNLAKKSKDGDFFINYISKNKGRLIEEEKARKSAKKQSKKQESSKEDEE